MTNFLMKSLASIFALSVVLMSSADAAQTRKQRKHVAVRTTTGMAMPAYRANLFPPGPVMYGNQYLGNDPDPFIRSQIQRDLGAHFGGSD